MTSFSTWRVARWHFSLAEIAVLSVLAAIFAFLETVGLRAVLNG